MNVSPSDFESWTPEAQRKALAMIHANPDDWRPFYCGRQGCDGKPHGKWQWSHARASQKPPPGDWLTWAYIAGRGAGKTRSGTEWTHRLAKAFPGGRIAIIEPTGNDIRDTIVEGESGLLAKSPPGEMPVWEPSKRKLTWKNGFTGYCYSGEEPDRLRGKQHHFAWVDEAPHIDLIEDVWYNLLFGLRLGKHPRILITTTPLPTKWMKDLLKRPNTVLTSGSTYDNLDNLSPIFKDAILSQYAGTTLGRQEIEGRIVDAVDGALWTVSMIDQDRVDEQFVPEMRRIYVAVDPAGSSNKDADETGIVVVGLGVDDHYYVLEDGSGHYSPYGWASRASDLYEKWKADAIVAEINYGREMVATTLQAAESDARLISADSRRGKIIRADPVVALYERHSVHHVGVLQDLEDQLISWTPGKTSPDRLDALVHGIRALDKGNVQATIARPSWKRDDVRYNPMAALGI